MKAPEQKPNVEPALGLAAIRSLVQKFTGHKPAVSTVHRWYATGQLKYRFIGGRIYSTESAIRSMLESDAKGGRR